MRQHMRAFDTYTHINELKEAGFNEKQAAVIIKSLVDSRETDTSHLATREQVSALEIKMNKIDNKIDIAVAKLEATLIKWMIGTMIAFSGILLTGIKLL